MGRTLHQLQTSFTSGELDPRLAARTDTKLYFAGLAQARNVIIQPQGGCIRRPGMQYIDAVAPELSTPVGTYTYPRGGTGADDDFLAGGDATIALSTSTLSSATPFVLVQVDFGVPTQVHCVDVHNLYISVGFCAFKVQYSTDAATWADFSGGETITVGLAAYAQYRRIVSTAAATYDEKRYWRLVLGTYDASAAGAFASVGSFICHGGSAGAGAGGTRSGTPHLRLVPFEFSDSQIYMLALSELTASIYKNGTLLRRVYLPYLEEENATPVFDYDLAKLNWAQSADTAIFVHRTVQPVSLVRSTDYLGTSTSEANWVPSLISFDYVPKYNFTQTATSPAFTLTPNKIEGGVTLTASGASFTSGNLDDIIIGNGGILRITQYTSTTVVKGVTLVPFFDTTAIASGSWTIYGDYTDAWSTTTTGGQPVGWPRSVTFHEGRLWFGGSYLRPHTTWGSRVDDIYSFDPGQGFDDDAVEFTLDTDQVNSINNVFSGRDLQIFTLGGEFFVEQTIGEPITPATAFAKRQTTRGSKAGLRVLEVDGGTIFVQREGTAIREFIYADIEQTYNANNISLLSSHLISNPVDFCLRPATDTDEGDLIIAVNDDGTVATCSTLRNQEVTAWSLQTTLAQDGTADSIVAAGALKYGGNETYFIVERGGVYFVERWNPDHLLDHSKRVAVVAASTATGFTHLASQTVRVLLELSTGEYTDLGNRSVDASGNIALGGTYTGTVEAGYPFYATGQTMPAEPALPEGTARGRKKRVVEATFLLRDTGSLTAQDNTVTLASTRFAGQVTVEGLLDYTDEGQLSFGQADPLPLNILGIVMQVSV